MENNFENLRISQNTKNILQSNGFHIMTEIQSKSIPILLSKKDLIAQSSTGTGKTLSFVIPIVDALSDNKFIDSVIISPTRELATQTFNVFKMFTDNVSCCIGGLKEDKNLENNDKIDNINNQYEFNIDCSIIVGTPGKLQTIIKQNVKKFSKVKFLILDEADRLLDMGFKNIILGINKNFPSSKNTALFSATIDQSILALSKLSLRNPVTVKCESIMPEGLKIKYLVLKPFRKLGAMLSLLKKYKNIIVFFSTCAEVKYYTELFKILQEREITYMHGKMKQSERFLTLSKIGHDSILFCTDLAARGLDFEAVDLVIHFSVPVEPMNILHRSGRSARNGKQGESIILLMENEDKYISYLKVKHIEAKKYTDEIETISYSQINNIITKEIKEYALKAFISHIRAYKEHVLSILLSLKEINYDSLVALHFLEKIPGMDEIRGYNFKRFVKPPRELLSKEERIKKYKQIAKNREKKKLKHKKINKKLKEK
ncbi:Dead box ATP-dependent RNA helicase [Spraguea lophii 42_110]|uniref:ATP-dependent RNA helicase n=1 Tax=Spraguea lophii (strain 42_110) TaxID=1358809 RepID=S7XKR7_SPRLO|nr:Dead box ATP-dependent RNA helicase [Spraguea lophii 42_110]